MQKKLNWKKSLKLYEEETKYLPAGTSSNARLWRVGCPIYEPCSVFIKRAKGSHIWDVDGNKYIDYRLGYGPVILGHGYKKVVYAVNKAAKDGSVYALGTELEIEVAKKMIKLIPCFEMVRFANSGTEATMNAIRLARAYTKKDKIIKFEGHYHGAHDYVLFSTDPPFNTPMHQGTPVPFVQSEGIPKAIEKLALVERWTNFETLERTVEKNEDDIACIITEPIMGNCSGIMPQKGYLKFLKKLCDAHGVLLIFDEVKTGFRVSLGGAQELFGVKPHLATFAKSMGNGYPVAAIAGVEEVMSEIGPHHVVHGGTYSSNPVSLAAVDATLGYMSKHDVFKHLNSFGEKLMAGIGDVFKDKGVEHKVLGCPSMFQFLFTTLDDVKEYRDLATCDLEMYSRMHYELLKEGVMVDEDNEEVMFTSYSHGNKELNATLDAFEDALPDALVPKTSIATITSRERIAKK